jgi:hypothetical protein
MVWCKCQSSSLVVVLEKLKRGGQLEAPVGTVATATA